MIRVGPAVLLIGCALPLGAGDTEARKRRDILLAEAWEHELLKERIDAFIAAGGR